MSGIFELYRSGSRYCLQRRGAVKRSGAHGLYLDAVVLIEDETSKEAELALGALISTPANGPDALPDVGTLGAVLQARANRALELIAKHLGMFPTDAHPVVTAGFENLPDGRTRAIIQVVYEQDASDVTP